MRSASRAWLAGLVVGVSGGVLTLVVPSIGWLIIVAFALPALVVGPRVAALGGLLGGVGSTWIVLLVRSSLECRAFDEVPGQGCVDPDLAPWLSFGLGMLAIGVGLTLLALADARRAWTRRRSI
jgi:hypothetical protein